MFPGYKSLRACSFGPGTTRNRDKTMWIAPVWIGSQFTLKDVFDQPTRGFNPDSFPAFTSTPAREAALVSVVWKESTQEHDDEWALATAQGGATAGLGLLHTRAAVAAATRIRPTLIRTPFRRSVWFLRLQPPVSIPRGPSPPAKSNCDRTWWPPVRLRWLSSRRQSRHPPLAFPFFYLMCHCQGS